MRDALGAQGAVVDTAHRGTIVPSASPRTDTGSLPGLGVPPPLRKPAADAAEAGAHSAAPAAPEAATPADEQPAAPKPQPKPEPVATIVAKPAPVAVAAPREAKSSLFADPDSPIVFATAKSKAAPASAAKATKASALFGDSDDEEVSLFKPRAAPPKAEAAPQAVRKPSLFEDSEGEEEPAAAPPPAGKQELPAPAVDAAADATPALADSAPVVAAPAARAHAAAAPARGILDFGALRASDVRRQVVTRRAARATPAGGGIGETEEDAMEQARFEALSAKHAADAQKQLDELPVSALEEEEDVALLEAPASKAAAVLSTPAAALTKVATPAPEAQDSLFADDAAPEVMRDGLRACTSGCPLTHWCRAGRRGCPRAVAAGLAEPNAGRVVAAGTRPG